MSGFYFHAPTLFEPSAVPGDDLRGALHDAKGMADILAKSGKLAVWLETAMRARGLSVTGPFIDESGWLLEVKPEAGFVVCNVSSAPATMMRFSTCWFRDLAAQRSGLARSSRLF